MADDGAGVAAQHTLTLANNATSSGVISIAILDKVYQVAVVSGSTPTAMATALVAILAADPNLPFTVANVAGVVTFTAKNKGTVGNWFAPVINPNIGDALPGAVTLTIAVSTVVGVGVLDAVSYTHLDVYKRQVHRGTALPGCRLHLD